MFKRIILQAEGLLALKCWAIIHVTADTLPHSSQKEDGSYLVLMDQAFTMLCFKVTGHCVWSYRKRERGTKTEVVTYIEGA